MMRWRAVGVVFALAALVSCAPFSRDIPFVTLESRYANDASRYMDLSGGVRMHYRVQGPETAPTLVLVHGFGASLHTWESWIARLGADYRIVSVDLPGHGLTRAPEGYAFSATSNAALIEELAERLGLERFTLVGHSMGGAVAVRYALHDRARLNALVLVDAAAWPRDAGEARGPGALRLFANPVGRTILRHINPQLFAERGLASAYHDRALATEEVVSRFVDMARAPGHRALLSSGRNNRADAPLTPGDFSGIGVATLVMHGEDDRIISLEDSRALAAAIPSARLVLYPDVGHIPMEEAPDASARDMRAFLAGLAPPR